MLVEVIFFTCRNVRRSMTSILPIVEVIEKRSFNSSRIAKSRISFAWNRVLELCRWVLEHDGWVVSMRPKFRKINSRIDPSDFKIIAAES